jgi:hypothetical protein
VGRLMPRYSLILVVSGLLALGIPTRAQADGAWLDNPLFPWNTSGMAIPTAPPLSSTGELNNPMCLQTVRPAETPEDTALSQAGWMLQGPYHRGWGVTLVTATNDWDGMCRPAGYQGFVFVDGAFAGTVAPSPTFARTDGSFRDIRLLGGDSLSATFVRYAETDPLCCPSRGTSYVTYRIEQSASGPVLVPTDVFSIPSED